MLKLYSNIKRLRKQLNMSQQELAEAVGYKGKSMIAQVENGKVDLSASMISKFAEVFNVSELELMGLDSGRAVTEPPTIHMVDFPHYDWEEDSETEKALEIYRDIQSLSLERRQALEEYLRYLKSQS